MSNFCNSRNFEIIYYLFYKDYSTEEMTEPLLTLLQHLREFGLVYQRKVRVYFYFLKYMYLFAKSFSFYLA